MQLEASIYEYTESTPALVCLEIWAEYFTRVDEVEEKRGVCENKLWNCKEHLALFEIPLTRWCELEGEIR